MAETQKYYDGQVQFTLRIMTGRDKLENGNNDKRATWYCPQCGIEHISRWSGCGNAPDSGIAVGCICGLWIESDSGSFLRVDRISDRAKQPLKTVPLRDPTPPLQVIKNGVVCYVCGCCGIEGDDLAPGDRVVVRYVGGGYVGTGVAKSICSQSQGHQIWTVLFDEDAKMHTFGRGCLTKVR